MPLSHFTGWKIWFTSFFQILYSYYPSISWVTYLPRFFAWSLTCTCRALSFFLFEIYASKGDIICENVIRDWCLPLRTHLSSSPRHRVICLLDGKIQIFGGWTESLSLIYLRLEIVGAPALQQSESSTLGARAWLRAHFFSLLQLEGGGRSGIYALQATVMLN